MLFSSAPFAPQLWARQKDGTWARPCRDCNDGAYIYKNGCDPVASPYEVAGGQNGGSMSKKTRH